MGPDKSVAGITSTWLLPDPSSFGFFSKDKGTIEKVKSALENSLFPLMASRIRIKCMFHIWLTFSCVISLVIVLNLIVTSDTSSVTLKQFTQIISLRVILQRILTMLSVHYICQSVFQMQNQLRMLRPDLEKVWWGTGESMRTSGSPWTRRTAHRDRVSWPHTRPHHFFVCFSYSTAGSTRSVQIDQIATCGSNLSGKTLLSCGSKPHCYLLVVRTAYLGSRWLSSCTIYISKTRCPQL